MLIEKVLKMKESINEVTSSIEFAEVTSGQGVDGLEFTLAIELK